MNLITPSDIPIVIAAGGNGKRMGGNKPERMLAGKRLIDHALSIATKMSDNVAVAIQVDSKLDFPDLMPRLFDRESSVGPLSALTNALEYAAQANARHVLLMGCDMPFLPLDLLPQLDSHAKDDRAVIAQHRGRLQLACALWPTSARNSLDIYAASGRRSLHGFAEMIGCEEFVWKHSQPDPFLNINTADDLVVAEERFDQMDSNSPI